MLRTVMQRKQYIAIQSNAKQYKAIQSNAKKRHSLFYSNE